jgi:hypothetical protein
MATLILVASLLLSWWSFERRRALSRQGHSETVSAKVFENIFEFSVSLAAVLLFYNVLLIVVSTGWQWITVADLVRLEHWLTVAQRTLDRYKPEWSTWMAVLVVLYLLGRLGIRFLERDTRFRVFRKTKSILHIINMIMLLLSSFTLLGFHPGKAATTLEIHLRKERKEYGVLQRKVGRIIRAAKINQAFDNAGNAFPDAARVPHNINSLVTDGTVLQRKYADAEVKYAIHDHRIETLLKRNETQRALLKRASRAMPVHIFSKGTSKDPKLPSTVRYIGILKARARVEDYMKRVRPEALRFLKQPGGEDILVELPEGPIDHLTESLNPIAEPLPLFKPILDVMSSILTDAAEVAIKRKIDDLTRSR